MWREAKNKDSAAKDAAEAGPAVGCSQLNVEDNNWFVALRLRS